MSNFICPPNHRGFKALALTGKIDDSIKDCAIAYIEPLGGGPEPDHSHPHNHLFTVISGIVVIRMSGTEKILQQGESLLVPGNMPHSVWNPSNTEAKVIGISLEESNLNAIPNKTCQSIEEVRQQIDRIDRLIVLLLAERGGYVKQAATFKKTTDDVKAPQRVEQVIAKTKALADELGASTAVVEQVYRAMIAAFINAELSEHARLQDQST